MLPSIFGENMFDDFFDGGFFGARTIRCTESTEEI